MLRFIYALVFSLFSTFAHAQYQGTTFNVPTEINGTGAITGIFLNTTTSAPAPGTWIAVDITTLGLPSNTVALNLGGFLIITNGSNTGTSDLTIAFRAYGDTNISCGGNYIGQAIAPNPPSGNGIRQPASFWIRPISGKFEYCWQRGIVGTSFPSGALAAWPTDPAFAINLNIEAWVTP